MTKRTHQGAPAPLFAPHVSFTGKRLHAMSAPSDCLVKVRRDSGQQYALIVPGVHWERLLDIAAKHFS